MIVKRLHGAPNFCDVCSKSLMNELNTFSLRESER